MIRFRSMLLIGLATVLMQTVLPGFASERKIFIFTDKTLIDNGFLKFLLPRFSLKNSIRTQLVNDRDGADIVLTAVADGASDGKAAFSDGTQTSYVIVTERAAGSAHAKRFSEWLRSDIGQKTIGAFKIDGQPIYMAAAEAETEDDTVTLTGDAAKGERLSLRHCGRCHVVGEKNRLDGIGSTPSFALLRTFPDWETRFATFYVLNPHPAFTQIANVTPPFDPTRPPAISPLELVLDDVDNILAFVAGIKPAQLGAPIKHQ